MTQVKRITAISNAIMLTAVIYYKMQNSTMLILLLNMKQLFKVYSFCKELRTTF